MIYILNLETSTSVCSVSVTGDGKVLSFREQRDDKSHATQLIPFIIESMENSGLKPGDLSAISVSKGPGSYTGLRIGVSTAKGLSYVLKVPIIAVDTLFCMASGFLKKYPEHSHSSGLLLCPMIDARRMEVYSSLYTSKLHEVRGIEAEVIHSESFSPYLKENFIHFFGDGAIKCKETLPNPHAIFHDDFYPSAVFMSEISFKLYLEKRFENLAYFEPFYLKDFVTTTPGNKIN